MKRAVTEIKVQRQMLNLLWRFRGRLACGLALMAITVVFQLALPKGLAYFIDHLNTPDIEMLSDLIVPICIVLIIQAIAMACRYYVFESTGYLVVHYVREKLFQNMLSKSVAFFDRHHVGELNSRLSADVETLHDTLTMGLSLCLRAILLFSGALIMMIDISLSLSTMLIMFIPVSLFSARWIGRQFRIRSTQKQHALAVCSKTSLEYLSHIRLVKAFNQQPFAKQRYNGVHQQYLHISLKNTALFAKFQSYSLLLTFSAVLLTLWQGAGQISSGEISTGDLTSFVLYAGMLSMSASTLSDFWGEWMRTVGATNDIFAFLSEKESCSSVSSQVLLDGSITFRDVCFSYPERPLHIAIDHLNFTTRPGERIALVGSSGAGKSTVAALLLGFYKPSNGQILLGSEQLNDLNSESVRQQIAIVEQEPSLFSGSIYENIAFAVSERSVSEEEVLHAAKLANADEFISAFPAGYHTQVGEHGMQLSGGQKQRIAIARAVLRDPKILILDEATSALDAASEHSVQQALDFLMQDRTTIIIAHRFSTIIRADRILVLEKGCLVQDGEPKYLSSQQDGAFYKLMNMQSIQSDRLKSNDSIMSKVL